MPNGLEKIIELINKTKNNCIILDNVGNPSFVVLNFEEYEKLSANNGDIAKLTEEQLLDKVNAEIALWKAANQDKQLEDWTEIGVKEAEKKQEEAIKKELNIAKIPEDNAKSAQDYFFEPVD